MMNLKGFDTNSFQFSYDSDKGELMYEWRNQTIDNLPYHMNHMSHRVHCPHPTNYAFFHYTTSYIYLSLSVSRSLSLSLSFFYFFLLFLSVSTLIN